MPKRPATQYTTDFSGFSGIVPHDPHKKRIQEEPANRASTSSTSAMEKVCLVSSFISLLRCLCNPTDRTKLIFGYHCFIFGRIMTLSRLWLFCQ